MMFDERIVSRIAKDAKASPEQVDTAIQLFDSGATIPFVARYRRDHTGGLKERALETIFDSNNHYRALVQRREAILQAAAKQDKLTGELRERISACLDKNELEDLYQPFKRARRNAAAAGRANGIAPIADFLLRQEGSEDDIRKQAEPLIAPGEDLADVEAVLAAARGMIAESMATNPDVRKKLRRCMHETGELRVQTTKVAEGARNRYAAFDNRAEPLRSIPPHRFLAIHRGVKTGALRVEVAIDDDAAVEAIAQAFVSHTDSSFADHIRLAAKDAYDRLLRPAIEHDVLFDARRRADDHAISVFRENTRSLLLTPAAGPVTVLGIECGMGEGVKLAVVGKSGSFLEAAIIMPDGSGEQQAQAKSTLLRLLNAHNVEAVAIGNGTGSRGAIRFVRAALKELPDTGAFAVIVNSAGAPMYSTSKLAQEEFPDLDVGQRSAVSIARRLQDPLAELVKIDPKNIGVGQYQHDVNQKALRSGLYRTVVSCVNRVGVDLNTAPVALLRYVSGIQFGTAQNIAARRQEKGPFKSRAELLEVPGIGTRVYEQCAGFLRISGGGHPLDQTGIHPEAYELVDAVAVSVNASPADLIRNNKLLEAVDWNKFTTPAFGKYALEHIRKELSRPGRDPRKRFAAPTILDRTVSADQVETGTVMEGMVTNVTDFGAFVDVGLDQDGLVHLSEIANHFVREPRQLVRVGQVVRAKVIAIDTDRNRISLSMKALAPDKRAPRKRRKERADAPSGGRRNSNERAQKPERRGTRSDGDGRGPGKPSGRKRDRRPQRNKESAPAFAAKEEPPLNTQLAEQLAALREKLGS